MLTKRALFAILFLAPSFALADNGPVAKAADQIVLSGDITKPGPVTIEELKLLGRVEKQWTMHGKVYKVVGARLDRLLASRGFTPGKMGKDLSKADKRAGWRKIALLTAADGYQALLSCAEMAQEMGPTVALLVWEIDGKPLDEKQGPIRLIVTTDQEPSRSIFGVRQIEVLDVPALHPQAPNR